MKEITIHIKDSTYENLKTHSLTTPEGRAAAMLELMVEEFIFSEKAEKTHR